MRRVGSCCRRSCGRCWGWDRSRFALEHIKGRIDVTKKTVHDALLQDAETNLDEKVETFAEVGIVAMYAHAGHVAGMPGVSGRAAGRDLSGRDLRVGRAYGGDRAAN